MTCQAAGDPAERDLTWLFASHVTSIARDGTSVVFAEVLGNEGGRQQVFRRPIDGAPAVPLGMGTPLALSPNGSWVLVRANDALALVPTGAGSIVNLSKGRLARVGDGGWLDDATVVFTAWENNSSELSHIFVQSVSGGEPRQITPEDSSVARAVTPDGHWVLGQSGGAWRLYPLGEGQQRIVPGLAAADLPIEWMADGHTLYVGNRVGRQTMNVFRVDTANGRRTLWKTLTPSDPVGVDAIQSVALTPDGSAYCYSHLRRLGDLFVVAGLK
jgi:hypothetical protein